MSLNDRQMKGLMMKICAMLLALWYCMSIVGFDMHMCKASGRTFVTTFAEGITCDDIHPEHHCDHDCHNENSCCHQEADCCGHNGHENSVSVDSEKCCTDSYQAIVLTGCRAQDDGMDDFDCRYWPASYAYVLYDQESFQPGIFNHSDPDSWIPVPCDRCVTYGVWRI